MAAHGPDPEWLSVETVNKLGAGMVVGAGVVLAAIKRGWLVFGEKVNLAAEVARLTERVSHLTDELKEHQETIIDLRKRLDRPEI